MMNMSEIKILLTDDEEEMQHLLAQAFEKDGYEVIAAYDGNEALNIIQQESFDLAIIDIKMPGRNGIEILKALKEKNPDTEVLIITGHASLETAIESVRYGAYDYVEKPFDIHELKKIVARALEKRRLILEKHELMEQLQKRVFELDVLYNISNAINYTLDQKKLVSLIMASINKVVEHDVSCSLLSTGQGINLMVQKVKPVTEDFIHVVKANIIDAFNAFLDNPISESEIEISQSHKHMPVDSQLSVKINFKKNGFMAEGKAPICSLREAEGMFASRSGSRSNNPPAPLWKGDRAKPDDFVLRSLRGTKQSEERSNLTARSPTTTSYGHEDKKEDLKVQSFFNVPLMIQGEVVGMINVSSSRKDAFDENDVRLLYTIAHQMSNAIKRLKAVIATEKSKMKTMVDGMIEGVIMIDKEGYMMVLNPSVKRMLSFDVDHEVTASQLTERFKELNIAWILKENFGGRQEYGAIQREITLDNKIIHISAEKIHDDNNQTIGLVIVLRDITQQKKIEQAKLDFVSGVSHEIRTPLSMIRNAVSIIEMAGEVNEKQQRFLSIATRNIDRLARLVNGVLDISKMESGKLEMQFEMLSVRSLIDDSIEAQKTQADEKGIQILGKVDEGLLQVYGDRDKLEQVLTNLLDNAMKFTNEGGCITIEAKRSVRQMPNRKPPRSDGIPDSRDVPPVGKVSVSEVNTLKKENRRARTGFVPKFAAISVSDTGVGISTDDQKKIFDKFQQVSTSSCYKTTGFGLGLAITKELILSHQGRIWVDSELGKGSTFTFTIPIDRESYEIAQSLNAF